ncbi:hypothetical protein [Thalassomonas actiniarum]|uniref:Lipoprotein n=1 Tax=Thalassomonas actiniarum TaxID=485447 RepID=A0AAE9YSV8_9GAMM|nr:hypothetical protein [Thalassomonas actiniarum]WDE00123.1 hypothetical protein SG35_005570 [Thalassomonas actiniarum]
MKQILSILVILVLSGCVSTAEKMKSIVENIPEQERAYVLGKFSIQCRPSGNDCDQVFNSLSLFYRETKGKDFPGTLNSTSGAMFGKDTTFDFISPEDQEKGFYFCQAVPASEYAFYTYRYYNFANGGSGYSLNKEGFFDLPFTANSKQLTLLGELKLTTNKGENLFGMDIYGPGQVIMKKISDKETALAVKKCPSSVRDFKLVVTDFKANDHPLIIRHSD